MSDEYRKRMDKIAGKGGIKCQCCNGGNGKSRKIIRRIVRRMMKYNLIKLLKDKKQ